MYIPHTISPSSPPGGRDCPSVVQKQNYSCRLAGLYAASIHIQSTMPSNGHLRRILTVVHYLRTDTIKFVPNTQCACVLQLYKQTKLVEHRQPGASRLNFLVTELIQESQCTQVCKNQLITESLTTHYIKRVTHKRRKPARRNPSSAVTMESLRKVLRQKSVSKGLYTAMVSEWHECV